MRYALISDIHSNLEALRAVLDALSGDSADAVLCLGDVVGYGADPKECIRLVKSLGPKALIAGNHEWGSLGLFDLENFNEYARRAVLWTRSALAGEDFDYLKSFRLTCEEDGMDLVHGSLDSPERFNYIFDAGDASSSMKLMKGPVCFVGHTHAAGIFYSAKGEIMYTKGPRVAIEGGSKYIVNVGSVGQPRDGDSRASYAIYDTEEKAVEIRRVPYDIGGAQEKIIKAGLPGFLAQRLSQGR